jgi:hypothetical protein
MQSILDDSDEDYESIKNIDKSIISYHSAKSRKSSHKKYWDTSHNAQKHYVKFEKRQ